MANYDPRLLDPTLAAAPAAGAAPSTTLPLAGGALQSHHGLVGLVLVAVLVLFLLDRAGFRFAVAVGRS